MERKYRKKNIICAVFLDFKRAFETLDRNILLKKLQKYGFEDKEFQWFKSYLNERTQKTKVDEWISEPKDVCLGVPQGSVLGTILFLIYINDISKIIKNSKIRLFADDTLLFINGTNESEIKAKLEEDLKSLDKWLKMNKLKLNTDKTKFMMINSDHDMNIRIDGEQLESVKEIKYLGIILDNKLNFKSHVNYIAKKIAKKIGFFKRIRNKLTTMCAINIYNAIIKPHFEYCSTILFLCDKQSIERLQKLQNKAMRSIIRCNRFTSIKLMLDTLLWLNVKQRLELNVLLFIYNLKNGKFPKYLQNKISLLEQVQPYNLRNADVRFRLGKYNLTSTQNSLVYKGFKKFNELPRNVQKETKFDIFKKECILIIKREIK